MSTSTMITAFLTVALLVATTRVAEGQQNDCASRLVACAEYINSTAPPRVCCNAINEVVTTQLPCLCNLYNTPGLLASLGINVTQALLLPRACNLSADTSVCSHTLAPGPSSSSPPATTGGNGRNGVGTLSWTAMPALFLVWAVKYLH